MGSWEISVVSIAAAAASLTYIARAVRRLAAAITGWEGLPQRHAELAAVVEANTMAIRDLITQVARLSKAEETLAGHGSDGRTP